MSCIHDLPEGLNVVRVALRGRIIVQFDLQKLKLERVDIDEGELIFKVSP